MNQSMRAKNSLHTAIIFFILQTHYKSKSVPIPPITVVSSYVRTHARTHVRMHARTAYHNCESCTKLLKQYVQNFVLFFVKKMTKIPREKRENTALGSWNLMKNGMSRHKKNGFTCFTTFYWQKHVLKDRSVFWRNGNQAWSINLSLHQFLPTEMAVP